MLWQQQLVHDSYLAGLQPSPRPASLCRSGAFSRNFAFCAGEGSSTGDASISGNFIVPYLADENADEDPELRVSTSSEGSAQVGTVLYDNV